MYLETGEKNIVFHFFQYSLLLFPKWVYMLYPVIAQGLYGSWKNPGILFWHFPGLESPGKLMQVLESAGNL